MTRTEFLRKRLLPAAAFCLLAGLLLGIAGAVLRPPQDIYGATWRAYLAEPEDSLDVLYLGSSYAYCDFDPVEIYRNSGLTGYVIAGSEQTPALTYWYLSEALKTQSPQAVVMEVSGAFFPRYQNYTQLNVVYMPFSFNKLGAIFTASESELRTGLLCDLWFYHTRWREVRPKDLARVFTPAKPDPRKGFTPLTEKVGTIEPAENSRDISEGQYEENFSWLLRILEKCQEEDISVLLIVNPTFRWASDQQYRQLEEDMAAAAPEALFVNWCDHLEGLDPPVDFLDREHLNQYGAAIYAKDVAKLLTEELGLSPMEQTEENRAVWERALTLRDAGCYTEES